MQSRYLHNVVVIEVMLVVVVMSGVGGEGSWCVGNHAVMCDN